MFLKSYLKFQGIEYCPGIFLPNITTTDQIDHTANPVLFNVARDPAERYPISSKRAEYEEQIAILRTIVDNHKDELIPGEPVLNWCDYAVMVRNFLFSV